jgi:uncharacterized membrane protein
MKNVIQFLIAFAVFLAVDLVWLGLIAKNLYSKYLGFIMTDKVNWIAALLFYVLFIIGLLVFVIQPALIEKNLATLVLRAALFGLVTYATYDLTNLATLKDWPIQITIIDLIWGTSLSTIVSVVSYFIIQQL